MATLLLGVILVPLSDAKIGYDITARVNSSTWSIERSTQNLNFEIAGSVSGSGSFTRLTHINHLAGIESHELTSSTSPTGRLNYEELMQLQSLEGPVVIIARLKSGTNESINESLDLNESEFINISIDERWPTRFSNYKIISYLGPGIRTRESYQNNGDVVETSIDSWKLAKESIYQAQINRSVTTVDITSDEVVERTHANKSSRYGLSLETIGSSTHLDVIRLDESREPTLRISQDYLGEERINLNITMNDWVPPPEEPKEWLECCNTDEAEKAQKCSLTPSLDRFFFNPTP